LITRAAPIFRSIDLFATESGGRIYTSMGFVEVGQPAMRLRVPR